MKSYLNIPILVFFSLLILPAVAQETWKGKVAKSTKQSVPYQIEYVKKAPPGAPNIVWILLDDVGFGASSAFGGLVNTPIIDSLANNGLRYVNFHTTGICSPTRTALLTGRNHHSAHMGMFPHYYLRGDYPGYDAHIPSEKGTIAEVLRANGYNTYQLGKWHLTPDEDTTNLGPFDRWPSGKGFDHNFGFLGGATDQYRPELVEDNRHVTPDGRHLTAQLTDKAISYLSLQQKVAPGKPFFLYFATGATHAPHQVDTVWSNKYKGKFDEGWDAYREQVFANQKKLGVIPDYAKLPDRNSYIKAWKDLSAADKKLFARFMEVYAGFLEYTDYEIGRLIHYLESSGQLDNTAVFLIIGDNGASKEGTEYGVTTKTNRFGVDTFFTRAAFHDLVSSEYDKIGSKQVITAANYPLGWAQAANTPFKFWKSDANAEGATHNPLILFYPKLIKEKGIRTQYSHLIDLFPTTLEITGLKLPGNIKGIKQDSLQGTSLWFTVADKQAASRHNQQYYCIFGNRAIYKDGWKAAAAHHPNAIDYFNYSDEPKTKIENNPDKDVWELYNLNEDFNERINLADKYPGKLKELKALFDAEAKKYNIYPLIDIEYSAERWKAQQQKKKPM